MPEKKKPTQVFGYLSLFFTIIASSSISFTGESIPAWMIYAAASVLGIMHNRLHGNRSMFYTYVFFLIMNSAAIIEIVFF